MLKRIPYEEWAHIKVDPIPEQVWKDEYFLVQVFKKVNGVVRLSVNKATRKNETEWDEGITWDELQQVKLECGFGHFDAVEIYPAQRDIVNIANIRHLWILDRKLDFAWRTKR